MDLYRRALPIAERAGIHALAARIEMQLASVAEKRGDVDSALETYRRALERVERRCFRALQRELYGRLKHIAEKRGATEEAAKLAEQIDALMGPQPANVEGWSPRVDEYPSRADG